MRSLAWVVAAVIPSGQAVAGNMMSLTILDDAVAGSQVEFVDIRDMSSDGRFVTGRVGFNSRDQSQTVAFRWGVDTGFQQLVPTSRLEGASSISACGSIVVGKVSLGEYFRWSDASGFQSLGMPHPLEVASRPFISDDGSTILSSGVSVATWDSNSNLWDSYGSVPSWGVTGLSGDGMTLFGEIDDNQAGFWTAERGLVSLGRLSQFPGAHFTSVFGSTPDANILVGRGTASSGNPSAFRWQPDTGMTVLSGSDEIDFISANAISADGSLIAGVGRYADSGLRGAVAWTERDGLVDLTYLAIARGLLPFEGFSMTTVNALSSDGRVFAGEISTPSGIRGYILTIPSPASLICFALVGGCCVLRRRRACSSCSVQGAVRVLEIA